MKANLNFHNEYEMMVDPKDRESILALFNKMSIHKPGLLQEVKYKLIDLVDGEIYLKISNMEGFDKPTKRVVMNFLNQYKYKKPVQENNDLDFD